MSGNLPYDRPIYSMIKEIETKPRPHIDEYSFVLNELVDRMLAISVKDRITIDEILESIVFDV